MPVDKKGYGCRYLPLFEAKLRRPMQRILIPLFFVLASSIKAQIQSQLYLDGDLLDEIQFSDSLQLVDHINQLQIGWVNKGFFFAGVDSVVGTSTNPKVFLHKGVKMKVNLPGYKGAKLELYLHKKLKSYANGGFPFASIKLDSTGLHNGFIKGKLLVDPGPEIFYDSIYFLSELKTNHSYIYQLIDVIPGNRFSEKNYRLISQKVERSPFLSLQGPTDLSFSNNKAKTFLKIKEETSSSFRGVLGLQQVQNGKTTVVGTLELDIQNLFRSGKHFKLGWERFAEESQKLEVYYKHPFFLDSKISPAISFDLLKQNTTFITRKTGLGIYTFITPRVELFLQYEATNGTLLSNDVERIGNSGLADFRRRVYKLEASKGHLTALRKLTNGSWWRLSASGGNKNIERNLSLPDSYYDTIQTRTTFYQVEAAIAYQIKVLKRQSFFHHLTIGTLQNDELLRNELYRLGGLNSLRGFNEKEIFAQSYLLSRAEFRSFFESESFVYVFYDQLIFQNESINDQPFGLGLGFALDTSSGQFSFALGLGNSESQNISFSTMKAHFGYISRF